jgi:hypothetical protein
MVFVFSLEKKEFSEDERPTEFDSLFSHLAKSSGFLSSRTRKPLHTSSRSRFIHPAAGGGVNTDFFILPFSATGNYRRF